MRRNSKLSMKSNLCFVNLCQKCTERYYVHSVCSTQIEKAEYSRNKIDVKLVNFVDMQLQGHSPQTPNLK